MLERFGTEGPGGVRLAVVTRIEEPNPGCACCGVSPEKLLAELEEDDRVVIADFEAGLGTLTRMKAGQLDLILVVAEPTAKSLEVARRALDLIREREVDRTMLIANRVVGEDDRDRVQRAFPAEYLTVVPDDPAIRAAELKGLAPYDASPDAPAVRVLRELALAL